MFAADNTYLFLREKSLLSDAKHAFRFLKDFCLDKEYGGFICTLMDMILKRPG